VRPIETVLIAPFLVLAATPELDLRRGARVAAALGGALAGAAAISLAVNAARFGSPLHNEYAALGARFALSWQGPLGLLVSPAWGLLFAFPALVVVPFGLGADPRDRLDRLSAVRARALVGFPVALWAVIGCWHMWWGGISWGPRLLVPALPFLAVLAARGLDELEPNVAKRIALACFALGLLQALPGVLVDLHGGYGALVSVTSRGWWAVANPALGGWSGLEHVLAEGPLDRHAVDVVWLRLAHSTRFASLGVPVVLLAGAAFIARRHVPAILRAPGFTVRSATWAADEAALRAVRFSVFVDEQAIDPEIEIDAHDAQWDHALALDDDDRPIGTARLSVEGGVGHIGRVAVLASWRRRGVGEALMRHLIEHASQSGVRRIEISAQLEAVPFYHALGFVAEGEIYSEAGIDHRHMRLDLGA
jgi:predicted GNAT family N-acyltransferase